MAPAHADKLRQLLTCPVDWVAIVGERDLGILGHDWVYAVKCCAIGPDEEFIAEDLRRDYGFCDLPNDIEQIVKNVETRIDEIKCFYYSRSGKFSKLKFLRPSEHKKHFRASIQSHEKITRETFNDPAVSLFFRDLRSSEIQKYFFSAVIEIFTRGCADDNFSIEPDFAHILAGSHHERPHLVELWNSLITSHNLRIAVRVSSEIGACQGSAVNHLCIDIHFDSYEAHAYPISANEAQNIMGEINVPFVS